MRIFFCVIVLKISLICSIYGQVSINSTFTDGPSDNWTDWTDAQTVIEEAIDIWEGTIYSPRQIEIEFIIDDMGSNVLAATGVGRAWPDGNETGSPIDYNYFYPGCLYEKIENVHLGFQYHFVITFNSKIPNWYMKTDKNCPPGMHDMLNTALHEIAHGLGMFSSCHIQSGGAVTCTDAGSYSI